MDAPRDTILVSIRDDTAEMEELVRALGYRLRDRVVQRRSRPDPGTFLGEGKLQEIRDRILEDHPHPLASGPRPLVVVDAALKPPQLFSIEDIVKAEVWDRIRVILEIFRQKAQVKEARLQVELAQLRYELPFVHEALHRTLTGEHPGFMGGGELEMRPYETHLKRRTKKIQAELAQVRQERGSRRAGRRKGGFHLAAIAGYTNSGKSSLLNALCGTDVRAEDVYFSTLETTTRKLRPEFLQGRPSSLLFTDTVGFIRDLPPWLIDAFASTLEEVAASDVILLCVDASEDPALMRSKLETAIALLDHLHATPRRILLLNKSDLLLPSKRNDILTTLSLLTFFPHVPHLWISTKTKEGLDSLVTLLFERFLPGRQLRIRLDPTLFGHLSFESWLRDHTDVLEAEQQGAVRSLVVRVTEERYPQLRRRSREIAATLEESGSTGK